MGTSKFFISGVVFGPEGYATVTNGSEETADPGGLFLCQFPAYPELPAGDIPAGGSLRVAGSELGDLNNETGELALYIRPDYSDPDAIAGYVQWGATGHKREEPALEAGLWEEGTFVDAVDATGLSTSDPKATSIGGWIKS